MRFSRAGSLCFVQVYLFQPQMAQPYAWQSRLTRFATVKSADEKLLRKLFIKA